MHEGGGRFTTFVKIGSGLTSNNHDNIMRPRHFPSHHGLRAGFAPSSSATAAKNNDLPAWARNRQVAKSPPGMTFAGIIAPACQGPEQETGGKNASPMEIQRPETILSSPGAAILSPERRGSGRKNQFLQHLACFWLTDLPGDKDSAFSPANPRTDAEMKKMPLCPFPQNSLPMPEPIC